MIFKFSERVESRLLDGMTALEQIAKTLQEINERQKKEIVVHPATKRSRGQKDVGR